MLDVFIFFVYAFSVATEEGPLRECETAAYSLDSACIEIYSSSTIHNIYVFSFAFSPLHHRLQALSSAGVQKERSLIVCRALSVLAVVVVCMYLHMHALYIYIYISVLRGGDRRKGREEIFMSVAAAFLLGAAPAAVPSRLVDENSLP